jgi:hypothetical protein
MSEIVEMVSNDYTRALDAIRLQRELKANEGNFMLLDLAGNGIVIRRIERVLRDQRLIMSSFNNKGEIEVVEATRIFSVLQALPIQKIFSN